MISYDKLTHFPNFFAFFFCTKFSMKRETSKINSRNVKRSAEKMLYNVTDLQIIQTTLFLKDERFESNSS